MYAALGFSLRHTLDAVNAALELEPRIGSLAYDVEHYFLYAPCLGGVFVHVFHFIAVALGVALVHAQQVRAEERRLVAAYACAYFQYYVFLVVGVLGQQHYLHILYELPLLFRKLSHLHVHHFLHLGVKVLLQHGLAVRFGLHCGGILVKGVDYLLKLAVLLYHLPPGGLIVHCVRG